MELGQVPRGDSDEGVSQDRASTAPSTPEGSLTFDPVFRAMTERHHDTLDLNSPSVQVPHRSTHDDVASLPSLVETRPLVRNICCVGAGYVGGPTAAVLALQNPHIRVTVVDKDERKIRRWNSKHLPLYEPGLREAVRIARDGCREDSYSKEASRPESELTDASISPSECSSDCSSHTPSVVRAPARRPNLVFSTDVSKCIREADVVLVTVDTPIKLKGVGAGSATDMTAFEAVIGEVVQYARSGTIIVEKSTVPCRTAQLIKETIAFHRPGVPFEILSNPEFLAAGTAMKDLILPDRVLIGSSSTSSGRRAARALADVYAAWVPRDRIITTNVWSSELSKLVANAMLAQRISSINSISAICEKIGAEIDEVAISIGRDSRIGNECLKAGIGFGGSCFKKDILNLVYLAESFGLHEVGEYWRQVLKMNEYQRDRFSRRVIECLNNTLVGKKITLLGYAFKANTSDTRGSPALDIIKILLEENPREIAIFDPCCNPVLVKNEIRTFLQQQGVLNEHRCPIAICPGAYEACAASNAMLIITDCEEFRYTRPEDLSSAGQILESRTERYRRPVVGPETTESDLLVLHKLLLQRSPIAAYLGDGPLQCYKDEPLCADDCPDCSLEDTNGYLTDDNATEYQSKQYVDWNTISYHMKQPKWLFDGRGIIDPKKMAELGFRVESIGHQGRF
ncbi:nucleotide sugar dehydrogenase [Xylariaceae sp. FL1019]|nr:nucleotide sugar dehydrogenase [Xylariaceae sp. FL1019]